MFHDDEDFPPTGFFKCWFIFVAIFSVATFAGLLYLGIRLLEVLGKAFS